jgi:hypothetical protein
MELSVHLLQDRTDLPDLHSVGDRQFAVGWAPPRELLVPDFGIRVAANSKYLRSIGLSEEWTRALAHDGLVRGMTGSHAVHVTPRQPLPGLLAELLARYTSTRYRAEFPLLDIIHAVPAHSNVVWQLNLTLSQRMRAGLPAGSDYAHAELWHRGEFYVLEGDRWFLVDRFHSAHLEGELAGIPDITGELALQPHVSLAHHADLLTRDMDLVFTTQSFARGSATAKRYREWPSCRAELAGIHSSNWPSAETREPRFVYALVTSRPGQLPFFSKVSLLHHIDRIHDLGFEVAFARQPIPSGSLPEPRNESLPVRDPH